MFTRVQTIFDVIYCIWTIYLDLECTHKHYTSNMLVYLSEEEEILYLIKQILNSLRIQRRNENEEKTKKISMLNITTITYRRTKVFKKEVELNKVWFHFGKELFGKRIIWIMVSVYAISDLSLSQSDKQ